MAGCGRCMECEMPPNRPAIHWRHSIAPPPVVTAPEPLRQVERKARQAVSSPFITVRYPDDAWELSPREKVPKVGDTLRRSGGKWLVVSAAQDVNGHVIVTWRRAPAPEVGNE